MIGILPLDIWGAILQARSFHVSWRARVRVLRLCPARGLVHRRAGGAGLGVRAREGVDLRHLRQPPLPLLSDAWAGGAGRLLSAVLRVRGHVLAPHQARTAALPD